MTAKFYAVKMGERYYAMFGLPAQREITDDCVFNSHRHVLKHRDWTELMSENDLRIVEVEHVPQPKWREIGE